MKSRTSNPFRPHLFTLAALLAAPVAHAAPIVWNAATLIAADTDVLNAGALNYAYNFNNAATAVNGVLFTGTNSTTTIGSDVTLGSGFANATNTFGAVSGTFNGLTNEYKGLLLGGNYATGAKTVTLQSLTSGRVYATQIWVNDSRSGYGGRTETVTSTGGNPVTLDYNNTETTGGVGQYSTGRFVADAATQVITISGSASPGGTQINAFQVREVTNIGNWVGTGGAAWDDATTNNFADNLIGSALNTTTFATAKAPLNAVTFADSYWDSGMATPVTQTTVTVDAAGVSTGRVFFDNSAVNYAIDNASGVIGITGSTAIVKNGTGTVTLNGANTYTGTTRITGGTLQYNSSDNQSLSGAISGSGTLTKANIGTLTSSAQNSFSGVLNIDGGFLEFSNNDNSTRNVFQSTQVNINNGATLRVSGALGNIELYNGRAFTFDSGGGGSILVGQGNYNANTAGFTVSTNGGARNNIGLISSASAYGMNLGNPGQLGTFNVALGSNATSDLMVTPIIANTGSVLKTGNGRLTFTANNTYSGTTTISAGTLIANSSAALGNASATNTLIFTGGTLQAGGTITSGANRKVTLTSTGIINTNGNTVNIAGIISGAGGLTKTGAGDLNLTGANTYDGLTTVNAGRLAVTAATHLSNGATSIVQSGTGQIAINAATISNSFNLSTTGFNEGDSRSNIMGAIRMAGGTLSGQITLSGNSRIGGFLGASGFQFHTISGKITGGFGIDFYGMQNVNNTALVFTLSNTGNDYTGDTTILNGNFNSLTNFFNVTTFLRLGASEVIPHGANAGNVVFAIPHTNDNAATVLDLNGFNETINGLTVNTLIGPFDPRITNDATGASVLTIGANDTTSAFSGTVTDAGVGKTLAITKIGTGTLNLSGTRTYSGDTTVSGGTLTLANPNPNDETSTVTITAGAFLDLTYGGTDTVDKLFVGATQLAAGEYGNSSSIFPVTPLSQITGSGTLTVTSNPPAGGFAAWKTANGTSQTIDLDHDDDGVSNGVEFFLGGTIDTAGFTTPLPGVAKALDGTLSVTWTKAATYPGTAIYGTHYEVETSATLTGTWTQETIGGGNVAESGNDVTYTFPSPLGTRKFARLAVTGP